MKYCLALVGLLLSSLLLGCDGGTELLVDLRTDYVAGHDFIGVRTEFSNRSLSEGPAQRTQEFVADANLDYLAGRRVAEFAGVEPGVVHVRLSLLGAGGVVVASRDSVITMSDSQGVTLIVSASCRGVVCPDGDNPTLTACLGGACVDPRCTPETPAFCDGTACAIDGDCAEPGGCASARCLAAVCFFAPVDGACEEGEICTLVEGCIVGDSPRDAGSAEGGTTDTGAGCAATEASCGDGADDDCDGMTDCADSDCSGAPCDDGSVCTADDVCGAGVCAGATIDCSDGNDCTDDTCDPSAGCASANNSAVCDDGSWCNGSDSCLDGVCSVHASAPCPTFCNESTMACEQCRGDEDCGTVSRGSWGACGSFADTCDETGTQSRTVMTPRCVSNSCTVDSTVENRSCTRDTDTMSCSATTYGGWGTCGSFSNTCDETGNQSRSVTTYSCVAGTCQSAGGTASRGCTRDTDGTTCSATTYGGWGSCGSFSSTCDETGRRSRSVTTYACVAASCSGSGSTQTGSCTRNTDGNSCSSYSPCPGACTAARCEPVCGGGCPC